METLLERARKISRLMQSAENVEYDSIARVLGNVLGANVYIVNRQGSLCGYAFNYETDCEVALEKLFKQTSCPEQYADLLLKYKETVANIQVKGGFCPLLKEQKKCGVPNKMTSIIPIYGVGERIGTLVASRFDDEFNDDDILLAEYSATVVGMEMLRDRTQQVEIAARNKAAVQIALATLSYSEARAAATIFSHLEGTEGLLVASRIADEANLTRSVIVNALRKFESAGVIEVKSLGMKGTHIKILNSHLLDEMKILKA